MKKRLFRKLACGLGIALALGVCSPNLLYAEEYTINEDAPSTLADEGVDGGVQTRSHRNYDFTMKFSASQQNYRTSAYSKDGKSPVFIYFKTFEPSAFVLRVYASHSNNSFTNVTNGGDVYVTQQKARGKYCVVHSAAYEKYGSGTTVQLRGYRVTVGGRAQDGTVSGQWSTDSYSNSSYIDLN